MSEKELLLERLDEMIRLLRLNVTQRPYIDQTYAVSASQGFFLDYKDRKHLYIFSPVSLTLAIGTIGSLTVPANTWTDISFPPNLQIFATGQANAILVLVRATDETINGASNGSDTNVNIAQIGGQTPTLDNTTELAVSMRGKGNGTAGDTPLLLDALGQMTVEDFIKYQIMQGHGFSATTGKQTSSGAGNTQTCIFAPANNAKNVLIYSIEAAVSSNGISQMSYITADPALGTAITIQNQALGNGAASTLTAEYTATVGATPGTVAAAFGTPGNTSTEVLQNGAVIFIAKNNAGIEGVDVACSTSTNAYAVVFRWIEW